ncbi:hypothetical protein [Actinokineospora sp. NBRC 105648]|uniref:hypothetical protein n=1 Tax=Actinokineospora sp. NBRC 105648 TaxID=3032206 RepID=UPI002556A2E0|nr:hypothetical protein [Actinokineospora sp. NBRC 105648]
MAMHPPNTRTAALDWQPVDPRATVGAGARGRTGAHPRPDRGATTEPEPTTESTGGRA